MSVSETFHQLSIRPCDLPSTFINFLSVRGKHFVRKLDLLLNFRQLSVWLWDLPSIFCASAIPSVRFCLLSANIRGTMHPLSVRSQDHPSNIRMSTGPFVNFHQLSVHPRDIPSTCVNFCASAGHSVNFLCIHGTFSQPASAGPCVKVSCISRTFSHLQYTFRVAVGPSVNILCGQGTFCQLQSTFHASMGPSLNFPCGRGTFRQHSLWLEDHSSTFLASVGLSVNFREGSVCPWDFTSILHASVNFRQLSVRLGELCQLFLYLRVLQRTSVNLPCVCGTIHQVLVHPRDILSTFLAFAGSSVNLREL